MNYSSSAPQTDVRSLPASLEAELSILGAILLDNTSFVDVSVVVEAQHFYHSSNGLIFSAMMRLMDRGDPVDTLTLFNELSASGDADIVGGLSTLVGLIESVHTTTSIRHHAKIVREKAGLRSLIIATQDVQDVAYSSLLEASECFTQAEQRIFDVIGSARIKEATPPVKSLVKSAFVRAEERMTATDGLLGPSSGLNALDAILGGFAPGRLYILAARPGVGKSSCAVPIATLCATERKEPALVVSLEMGADELCERELCRLAQVSMERWKHPEVLHQEEWDRIIKAGRILSDCKLLHIDDAAPLSLLDVRAKAKRVRAEHDGKLGVIIIDYLQLMTLTSGSRPRGVSREEEISGISRGLKMLAKELKVPVIALCQMNRDVEKRSDRRPKLADLRECLAGESLVYDPVTGSRPRIDSLAVKHAAGPTKQWKIIRAKVADSWSTGVKPVLKLRTKSGREERITANQPLLTVDGWVRADAVRPGTPVAVPRRIPHPSAPANGITVDQARLLGYLISDGSYGKHRSVSYVKGDHALVHEVVRIATESFGLKPRQKPCQGESLQYDLTTGRMSGAKKNPLIRWLIGLGIHGQLGPDKRIPDAVFRCDASRTASFLATLFAGDGSIVKRKKGGWVLKFTSTSRHLLRDVQHLLLRFGILGIIGKPERNTKSTMDIATLHIFDGEHIRAFSAQIGMPGAKGAALRTAASDLLAMGANPRLDLMPLSVTAEVEAARVAAGMSFRELGYRPQGKRMSRPWLAKVAAKLGNARFADLAQSDVLWDPVVELSPDGECETFDMRVPQTAAFVANDICNHNSGSLEQDADCVIFIDRPELYDDSPEHIGIAEFEVAKHRGGKIGRAKARFNGDKMTFSDYEQQAV